MLTHPYTSAIAQDMGWKAASYPPTRYTSTHLRGKAHVYPETNIRSAFKQGTEPDRPLFDCLGDIYHVLVPVSVRHRGQAAEGSPTNKQAGEIRLIRSLRHFTLVVVE